MAFVDNPNSQEDNQVTGANPLGQGSQNEAQSDASYGQAAASESNVLQSSKQEQDMQDQGGTTNKKSPRASSGMFTNIQKYVAKNQPQAKKMAGAVTQDFGKQAGDIRKAAEDKKAQQDQLLSSNKQVIGESKDWAQGQVDQIMNAPAPTESGTEPVVYNPSADQQQRFQDLMGSNIEGVNDVQELNLTQQQNRMGALSQLAKGANQEQGRRNLLGNTFKKQGEYTRGMSGLDQLITSGDKAARESLIKGTQDTTKGLGEDLQGLSQEARGNLIEQQRNIANFGEGIGGIAGTAQTGVSTDIDNAYAAEMKQRAALLDPESAEYLAATGAAQGRLDSLKGFIGEDEGYGGLAKYADFLQGNARSNWGSNIGISNYLQKMRDYGNTGQFTLQQEDDDGDSYDKVYSGQAGLDYLNQGGGLGMSHHKDRVEIAELMGAVNKGIYGDDPEGLYGLENVKEWEEHSTSNAQQAVKIMDTYRRLQDQYKGLGSADDIVKRKLKSKFGDQSYEDLASGKDIQRLDVAGQGQIDKINALKSLMGQEDLITEQQYGDQAYTSSQSLKDLLASYGGVS